MNEKDQLFEQIKNLLLSQKLAVLSTQNKAKPYASLVAFAETPDLTVLLFATTRSTRKFANLTASPHVALLVDSRTNDPADFSDAVAVTALGSAEEVKDSERAGSVDLYLGKHPYLKKFVTSPTCALLKITVKKYILVSRFQNVMELKMP